MKKCTKCLETKTFDQFYKFIRDPSGYGPECKPCRNKRTYEYKAKNKNRVLQKAREWERQRRIKNNILLYGQPYKPKKLKTKKIYTQLDKEKWRKTRKRKAAYYAVQAAKRNAAKKQRTPGWLTELDYEHIQLFYEAAALLTKETGIKFQVDHIIPLQGKEISGLHVPKNLQILSAAENLEKRNKFVSQ